MAGIFEPEPPSTFRRAQSKSQQVADFGYRPAISSSVVMSCITACIPPRID
jgi:hypothetical protein